jgi:vancomycin permeability regulator SanA
MNNFFKIIILLIGVFCGVICISTTYTAANYFHISTEHKECAVIFGAAVWRDNIPSHALYDRTMTGIDLYKNKTVSCLIFSGGPSKYGAHETDVMQEIARINNIPKEDILIDGNGLNTQDTIINLPRQDDLIFVSNDFHLGRIAMLANRYNITNFSLHKATYYNGRYLKEPQFFIHEVIGTIYYFFHIDRII